MPRSRGRQRKGPRRYLRPWEPRLAVVVVAAATLGGRLGATSALAAQPSTSNPLPTAAPATAAALAVIGLAILAWVTLAARRYRHRSPTATDEASIVLPTTLPPIADLDLDLIVTAARGHGSRERSRSGSATAAPVWVRRLDERIPIMPTHQNVPIDNDEPVGRQRRAGPGRSRGGDRA